MATIGVLDVAVRAQTNQFNSAMEFARKRVGSFGKDLENLAAKVLSLSLAYQTVYKVISGVKEAVSRIEDESNRAGALGLTTQQLREFRFAAKHANVDAQQFDTAFRTMLKTIVEGRQKGGGPLADIGLDPAIVKGDAAAAFRQIADALARIPDPMRRAVAAQEIFGKQGLDIVTMLEDGSKGLDEMAEGFKKLVGELGEFDVARIKQLEATMTNLDTATKGFWETVSKLSASTLNTFLTGATEKLGALNQTGGGQPESLNGLESFVAGALGYVDLLKDISSLGLLDGDFQERFVQGVKNDKMAALLQVQEAVKKQGEAEKKVAEEVAQAKIQANKEWEIEWFKTAKRVEVAQRAAAAKSAREADEMLAALQNESKRSSFFMDKLNPLYAQRDALMKQRDALEGAYRGPAGEFKEISLSRTALGSTRTGANRPQSVNDPQIKDVNKKLDAVVASIEKWAAAWQKGID